MATTRIEFKKGDNKTITFRMPIDSYEEGSTLSFTAKPEADNDSGDTAAVIDKEFGQSDVTEVGDDYATYTLEFEPADTAGITFDDGQRKIKYQGEFQYVTPDGHVESFPSTSDFIEVTVHADIKRAT